MEARKISTSQFKIIFLYFWIIMKGFFLLTGTALHRTSDVHRVITHQPAVSRTK